MSSKTRKKTNHQNDKRGLIFSNGTCTISTSEPSSTRCLTAKPPLYIDRDCRVLANGRTSLVVRSVGSHHDYDRKTELGGLFMRYIDSQALACWSLTSFQDRLLSKRIFHFCGDDGVLFECNTIRVSDHPKFQDGVPYSSPSSARPQPSFKPIAPGSAGLASGKIYGHHTRKMTIDRKSGTFKFETLVVTKDNQPVVQEKLEDLRSTLIHHCVEEESRRISTTPPPD